jgi:hypothetical protein
MFLLLHNDDTLIKELICLQNTNKRTDFEK